MNWTIKVNEKGDFLKKGIFFSSHWLLKLIGIV